MANNNSTRINQLLQDIDNYGKFTYSGETTYKNILDQLLGYGDFSYGQQGAYDAALNNANNYGAFTYDKQGAYDAALDKVVNPTSFSYDPSTDAQWSAYRKAYLREGDRAAQNALVQASTATGGVPSSYAVTAAQQAQNNYNAQLADILPTLAQNAYQQYLNDYNMQLQGLSALQSDKNSAYSQWQDGYAMAQQTLANLQSDRNTAYQQYLDAYAKLQSSLSASQADREQEYGQWSDRLALLQNSLGNYQNQDASDFEKKQQAYSNLLTLITTTGYVPDAATLAAAGMSAEEAAAWKAYYDKENPQKVQSASPVVDNTGNTREEWLGYITNIFTQDGITAGNAHIDALIAADPSLAWLAAYKRTAGQTPNTQAGSGGVGMKEVPRQTVSLK